MSKPKLLIVDDELFFQRLFSEILAQDDLYDIDVVGSGQEALDFLAGNPVDVILTDMVMPEVCGLELIRRTRSLDPPPDIILATGNATVESAIQALKGGARDYLLKPCNPEQLRHTVRSCLEQRRLIAENSLLHSQLRLYRKGQNLSGQLNIDALFQESLNTLINELGHSRGLAWLMNRHGISHVDARGFPEETARELASRLAERVTDMQHAALLSLSDCPELADLDCAISTLWIFPMHTDKDEHGALIVCNADGEELPAEAVERDLSFLAEQIALGFRNACQYQGARELIYTDDLTGLYNHRYLHIALEREIHRAERYGLEFSLAFIDIDLFKQVNDSHGHLVGSDVLRQTADLLRECVRDADMLFRYGGDEFTALLVETDIRGAQTVAERIRSSMKRRSFKIGNDATIQLTATIGHATFPGHARTKDVMIDLADKAMYLGKRERDTTRSATELVGD
jgi:diguanylate cyclase (GGDEF)-like protein